MANVKKRLFGVDVSHWQTITECKAVFPSCDFVILKATEGATYKDKTLQSRYDLAQKCGVELFGIYHFYSSFKTPEQNAENFLDTARKYLGNNNMMLICDIEQRHAEVPHIFDTDIITFCEIVEKETGIKPLIYTNSYNVRKMQKCLEKDYGLWVAHYGKQKPNTYMYGNMWALWQYTSKPIDKNYFNGNKKQFLAYCTPKC